MRRLSVLQRGIPPSGIILRVIGAKATITVEQFITLEDETGDLLMESGDKVKTEISA